MTTNIPQDGYCYDENGCLNIWVRGIPYGGPKYLAGKDFDGEYFTPETDIGPLEKVLSYWDHAKLGSLFPNNHPAKAVLDEFSETRIGVAEKELTDDEGVIWKIVVDRAYKYNSFLERLAQEKMIRASSTPYQRTVRINKETGEIEKWEVIEMTATVTSANPDAEQVVEKIFTEFGEELMTKSKVLDQKTPMPPGFDTPLEKSEEAAAPVVTEPAVEAAVAEAVETAPAVVETVVEVEVVEEATTEAAPAKSAAASIQAIIDGKNDEEPVVEEKASVQDLAQVLALLDYLSVSISGYASIEKSIDIVTPENSVLGMLKTLKELPETIKTLQKSIEDIQEALPLLSRQIKEQLKADMGKTQAELIAEKEFEKRNQRTNHRAVMSDLPATAPR